MSRVMTPMIECFATQDDHVTVQVRPATLMTNQEKLNVIHGTFV